jgi:hypothetical protein
MVTYVRHAGGYKLVAEKHQVNVASLRAWVASFRGNGIEGIKALVAKNIKKAKETEEVHKALILVLDAMKQKINFLSEDELVYLGNWKAENYRREK